jgi:hypothetical protein
MKHLPYNNCWSQYKYQPKITQQEYTMQAELEKFVLSYCFLDYTEVVYKIDSLKK